MPRWVSPRQQRAIFWYAVSKQRKRERRIYHRNQLQKQRFSRYYKVFFQFLFFEEEGGALSGERGLQRINWRTGFELSSEATHTILDLFKTRQLTRGGSYKENNEVQLKMPRWVSPRRQRAAFRYAIQKQRKRGVWIYHWNQLQKQRFSRYYKLFSSFLFFEESGAAFHWLGLEMAKLAH